MGAINLIKYKFFRYKLERKFNKAEKKESSFIKTLDLLQLRQYDKVKFLLSQDRGVEAYKSNELIAIADSDTIITIENWSNQVRLLCTYQKEGIINHSEVRYSEEADTFFTHHLEKYLSKKSNALLNRRKKIIQSNEL